MHQGIWPFKQLNACHRTPGIRRVGIASSIQVLAKMRAELTFSVFESVDAAESVSVNPKRDAFIATGMAMSYICVAFAATKAMSL